MSGFEYWLSGHDSMSGTLMLLLWAAGVVTALVIVVAVLAFRDFAVRETIGTLLRTGMVLIIAVLAWTWLDYSVSRERVAERRALDARASELTARIITPGSALACLNGLKNEIVETACEQAVFASPQAVAAAVAYVDARLALLADGVEFASRDRGYAAELEQPRRALEADRFGIVAHVLANRGCTPEDCAAFKLMKDASRVRANLKERTFETRVAAHASDWAASNPASASAATPPSPMSGSAPSSPPQTSSTPSTSSVSKFSFPSSTSIPQINIMTAEPTGTVTPKTSDNAAPERQTQPARRQSASKPPSGPTKPLPPPPRVPPSAPSQSQASPPNPQ